MAWMRLSVWVLITETRSRRHQPELAAQPRAALPVPRSPSELLEGWALSSQSLFNTLSCLPTPLGWRWDLPQSLPAPVSLLLAPHFPVWSPSRRALSPLSRLCFPQLHGVKRVQWLVQWANGSSTVEPWTIWVRGTDPPPTHTVENSHTTFYSPPNLIACC